MEIFFVFLLSYLSGSIPFGLILTKIFYKKDIRSLGSGNIGATNVLRTGNKFLALGTLILDILKGFAPVYITVQYFPQMISLSCLFAFLPSQVVSTRLSKTQDIFGKLFKINSSTVLSLVL